MRDVVICEPLRTAVGRFGGVFKDVSVQTLAATVISALVERTGIDGGEIDDVILGEGLYGGGVVARHAAITAGLSSVPGLAVNRHCAAGQAAVQSAAATIRAGMDQLILAGLVTPV